MAGSIKGLTVEIGGDTTKLGKALENVQKKGKSLSSELGQVNRLLKMDPGNADLLAQKQEILAKAVANTSEKLQTLKTAEKQVQKQFERGEVSEEQVRALRREVIATEKKMDSYKNAAKETEDAIRGVGDESKKTEKSSRNLGQALGGAVKTGLAAVAAVATAAVAGLTAAAESTREYRTEMGKLDAAYKASNHSTATASAAYKTLIGVIGETDQSVEAAQQIALLADSEKEVAQWSELAAGVVGRFGDALQPETFYEAANETLKLNESTGAFTQMLEGCGISVEDFNEKLQACKTTEEKQAYMLEVTEGALGKAGEAYKETNADIIEANKANDNWMQSLSGIGGAVEPIITTVKNMGASLLSDAVPGVQKLAEAFQGLMSGDAGAVGDFGAALSGLVTGLVEKITQALPGIASVGLSIIKTLATSITTNLPTVVSKGVELLGKLGEGLKNAMPGLISKGLDIIMGLVTSLYNAAPALIDAGFGFVRNLLQGLMDSLPTLLAKVPEIVSKFVNILNDNVPRILKGGMSLVLTLAKGIIAAIPALVKNIPKIITAIVDVWEAFNWLSLGKKAFTLLKNGITSMLGAIKGAAKSIMNGCTNALKALPGNLLNLGKNAVSGLGSALRSGVSTVKAGASAIFNGVVNFFKTLPSKMLTIGKDLVKGLWNGISDMTGWIIGKIQGFGSSVLDGIKSFFGISSPSRVMAEEVGRHLPSGIAVGVEKNAKAATNAMTNLSRGMMDATDVGGLSFERSLSRRPSTGRAYGAAAVADNSAILAKLDGIYERLGRLQVVLDSGATVGGLIDGIDRALATKQTLRARGV